MSLPVKYMKSVRVMEFDPDEALADKEAGEQMEKLLWWEMLLLFGVLLL